MLVLMPAQVLDGTAISAAMLEKIAQSVRELPRAPRLLLIAVGEAAGAARSFVAKKETACKKTGIAFQLKTVPEIPSATKLSDHVQKIISQSRADGMVVQLPLPGPFFKNPHALLRLIPEAKDADCLSEKWLGRMQSGRMHIAVGGRSVTLIPPVAGAVEKFLDAAGVSPKGKRAVVIGWGDLVGKPCAAWLLHQGATVTVVQKTEPHLAALLRDAEIVVSGAGAPHVIRGTWLREDAVVIDAGVSTAEGKTKGDVMFSEALARVRAITKTPGGAGPVAIAVLLENVVKLAAAHLQ